MGQQQRGQQPAGQQPHGGPHGRSPEVVRAACSCANDSGGSVGCRWTARVRHAPRFLPMLGVRDFIPRDTGARASRARVAAATARAEAKPAAASARGLAGRL